VKAADLALPDPWSVCLPSFRLERETADRLRVVNQHFSTDTEDTIRILILEKYEDIETYRALETKRHSRRIHLRQVKK
jgi:hypothetical protein